MDKKKIGLLIIVLFLIIGLGSFVFANPDNQENFEEGETEERDRLDGDSDTDDNGNTDSEESESNLLTDGTDSQSDNNQNTLPRNNLGNYDGTGFTTGPSGNDNGPITVEYDYYADALKAVENAESSLVQGDVDYASSLVDKVTNQSQKDELNKRLDAVQDIIDVTSLIERLEEMVANSTNRDGIVESIDYRDDENIEELVNDLVNGDAKDDLVDRLEAVNKILNDNKGPVISGIENNSFTNDDVSLTISDDNEVTTKVTLNGEEVEYTDTFTEEGTYVVTVVDAAFNENTLTFTIDKTAPEVISLTQEYQAKEDGRIKVTITTSEDVSGDAFHDYAWRKTGDNTYVNYYYKSEEVVINFVDQANNSGSYTFTVDADAPEILSLTQEYQAKEGGRIKVTITTSEEIYGDSVNKNGWRKVGDNTYENYYYRTKDVTINVTDKVGNPLVYIFTVDMDAPEVVVTKSNNDKSTNKNVIVTITGDEDIIVEDGWEKISDTVYTKEYSENGKYSVVVKDKVGNETTVNFEVKRIDKVAPTAIITKSNNDKSTNQDVVVTLVSNEAIYKPEGWTEVKTNKEHEFTKTYSENGKYSVVIKDKAGNETTINFEVKRIDRVAPEITVVDPNKYYLEAGEEYVDKGYSAYDEVDKDVTNLVKISYQFQAEGSSNWEGVDTLDTTKLGVYKLTYTAYDKAGNTAKGTRVVAIRDTKAPKFIGLEDGGIYNPATIQVDDATLKTITVYSKDSKETIEVENGYVIDKAGSYEITAIDQKNNKTTINVKVDITVPTYTFNEGYVEHNNVYGTLNLKLHDENGIASVVINGTQLPHTGYYVDINDGDAYTFKNGENTVTVTDEAGNTVTYTFIVDKNAPTYGFNGGTIENNGVYGTLNLKLHDENGIASVIINGTQLPHTGYYVDINDGDAYTFKDGENIVIVTDNLGNTETYTFVVDKKAPTYSISDGTTENNGVYGTLKLKLHDENGIASVIINGTQLPHTGYYVDINDGDAYTFKIGENIVVVTDIFGNTETYNFNVAK